MGLFDALFQGTSGSGGPLSGGLLSHLTGGQGLLSTNVFQTRLATIQAAQTPMDKISAFVGTLGMRFRTAPTSGGTSAQGVYTLPPPPFQAMPNYQSSAQRILTSTNVTAPPVQFS